ncbi:MAG: hypothetical protein PGN11_06770 [Quadrisphaera sp.]
MAGEDEHGGGEDPQPQDVHHPVEGDEPQHVPVAQRAAPQRQPDLLARREVLAGGLRRGGRGGGEPGVAPQAAVPAQAVGVLPEHEGVLPAHARDVTADGAVALEGAVEEVPPHARQPQAPAGLAPRLGLLSRGLLHGGHSGR